MEIQTHSSGFRAVGSTEDVDARDNTSTTYTSSDKGVPIYWLDGNKVVDDYEDFYDGSWDEETTLKNESGTTFTATSSTRVWTGSNNDGTEAISVVSVALGKNPARVGGPNHTNSDSGPLSVSNVPNRNTVNTATRRMYGLSSVFVVEDGTTLSTAVTIVAEHDSIGGGLEDLKFTLTREGATTDALDATVTIVQDESWLGDSDLSHDVTFEADEATVELTIAASEFSFAPSTTGDLTATVTGDGIDGGSETVAIISTSEPPITISYDMSSYTFAEDSTDAAVYVLATLDAAYPRGLSPSLSHTSTIALSTRTRTATSPEDFAAISHSEVLAVADFERDVDTDPLVARRAVPGFAIVNDEIYEGSEHFVMWIEATPGLRTGLTRFANPDGSTCAGAPGCTPEYTVNITDDDDLPELSLSAAPASIDEEDDDGTTGTAENVSTVRVEITNGKTFGVDQTVTLTFTGTATRGTHYSVSPGDADTNTAGHQVVLVKETASVEVTVTATGNDTADGHRTVTVAADLDGTAIGSSTTITIVDDETTTTTAPEIVTDGVEVTSTPDTGDTYRLGETIGITVTFDNAVTVNPGAVGPPRIQFRLTGSLERWADYSSGSGGTALVFTYEVQSGDMDDDGIFLPGSHIRLRTDGTITAAADNTVAAILAYDAPGLQPDHKVNGSTVPGAPTSLTATASGTSTIDLDWTAPSSDGGSAITGYRIEVSPNGTSSWSDRVADTDETTTTYSHTGLSAGTTRHYRVSAINANGTGDASNVDNATTDAAAATVPGAPTGLTATASGTSTINLDWDAPSNDGGASISGYRIEVSSNGGTSWTNREANTGSSSTSYSHTGLSAGTTRHYRVSAINSVGTGAASNVDDATTDDAAATVPGTPTGLTATASGTSTINLDWTAPSSDGGSAITGYRIEVSPNGNSNWTNREGNTGSTSTSYAHTGLDRRHHPPLPRLGHQLGRHRRRLQRRRRHHRRRHQQGAAGADR